MKKNFGLASLFLVALPMLTGCGKSNPILIWVGTESQEFYQTKLDEYVANYNATNDKKFPYAIEVKGVDTGSAAATFLDDTEAGADIFTVAHDNLGKLIAGSSGISPITDTSLLAQIAADNPDTFQNVIKGKVSGTEYTFGVPYIAQSLILYYNKAYLNATDVETWEGIWAKAVTHQKQALSLTGTDGFNNSFLLLARNVADDSTSLQLYEDASFDNCFATGDDTVSKLKWGQRFFTGAYGARVPSSSGWEVELKDELSLSVIGGAWHYNAALSSLGADNLGIAILPRFTITEADAYGTSVAGTVYQSGSFTDTKMLVMKKGSTKADYLQGILKFMSSKEIQEQSFEECANLPAYKNALEEFEAMSADTMEAQLARCQTEMFSHGIPQPFGANSKFNVYYYSKGAPELIAAILQNTGNAYSTDQAILDELVVIERVWKTGNKEAA